MRRVPVVWSVILCLFAGALLPVRDARVLVEFGPGLLMVVPVVVLWLGPSAFALRLARGSGPQTRRTLQLGAGFAALPLVLLELASLFNALTRYDGFCHAAPDVRFPCFLLTRVIWDLVPHSAFAAFGMLFLGIPAVAFGSVSVLLAWWATDNRAK